MDLDLIDRTKYRKDLLSAYDDVSMEFEVLESQPAVNAIIVLEGATNGDVFLITHSNVVATKIHKDGNLFDVVQLRMKGDTIPFAEIYMDWWNAPYKGD